MAGSFAECVLFLFSFDSHDTAGRGMPISQVGKLRLNKLPRGLSSAGEAGIPTEAPDWALLLTLSSAAPYRALLLLHPW